MRVVLLAAGKGVRLKPITETRPKPLIPILCKPLILWHLDLLEPMSNSIREIRIVVNYMMDRVVDTVFKHPLANKVKYVHQGTEAGTGDAIHKAVIDIDDDEDVLVIYSDLFIGDRELYQKLIQREGNVIVGVEHSNPREYGVLLLDEQGGFKGIIEKPEIPPTNLVNAGIYKFRAGDLKPFLENLKPSIRGELEFTDALTSAVQSGISFSVARIDGDKWIDIGLPWNILEANKIAFREYVKGVTLKGFIERGVTIRGDKIYIEKGSTIRSGTYIEGPTYISEGSVIGPNARIRPYTVVCGAKIGFSVEVKESIIMEGTHISHLSYVGDSIICENVNFGAGTITANLRFDDKPVKVSIKGRRVSSGRRKLGAIVGANVKTGINVSLMPGVKISSNTWIAPGAIVDKDIPPSSFLRVKTEYYIEPIRQSSSIEGSGKGSAGYEDQSR